jgi:hypothetical protein
MSIPMGPSSLPARTEANVEPYAAFGWAFAWDPKPTSDRLSSAGHANTAISHRLMYKLTRATTAADMAAAAATLAIVMARFALQFASFARLAAAHAASLALRAVIWLQVHTISNECQ